MSGEENNSEEEESETKSNPDRLIRIWHISDTHGTHRLQEIPPNIDVAIHTGDAGNSKNPF